MLVPEGIITLVGFIAENSWWTSKTYYHSKKVCQACPPAALTPHLLITLPLLYQVDLSYKFIILPLKQQISLN
ncbi:hypothetical protein [Clostridium sp. DL1XJH146]